RELAPKGALGMQPRAELVVFPSRLTGGVTARYDRARGMVLDREYSRVGPRPAAPYVWAWEVRTFLHNRLDGLKDVTYLVDASSGSILRKVNGLHAAAPVVGVGHSQYSGDVTLGTTRADDGTFLLWDQGRGTVPNPMLADAALNQGYTGPTAGLTTWYQDHSSFNGDIQLYESNPVNEWGDGAPFVGSWAGTFDSPYLTLAETTVNGQTAAVDAQHGVGTSLDFYRNVFGRDGIDGRGTSTFSAVHLLSPLTGEPWDNAFWSNLSFGMFYGDGSYGGPAALSNPFGFLALTEIDITGHEVTHGVTFSTADLLYGGESGGLNESASDILGSLIEAYGARPAGRDDVIPESGTDWMIGSKSGRGTPLRWMAKPSRDLFSANEWFDGIRWLDVHFSSGPMNRWFYFLSQGASADPAADTHSAFLPGGMAGIGNDKAGRIFFHALTAYMTPEEDYTTVRESVLFAAVDLHGAGSPEVAAVEDAFAAINVGGAHGQPAPVKVTISAFNADSLVGEVVPDLVGVQILPLGEAVRVRAEVENDGNTAVEWRADGPNLLLHGGGAIDAAGRWITPVRQGWAFVTATAKADPRRYAAAAVYLVRLDCDEDTEQDPVDMGAAALSWGLGGVLARHHSIFDEGFVDDFEVQGFLAALQNAFPVEP
ncbi:MAG: M4 family metallopeptidase, partial [Anaeromyxobacteraceae bacterium]